MANYVLDYSGEQVNTKLSTVNDKAPLVSPTFTGIPTAPTATNDTNSTQIATTEFVKNVMASAGSGSGLPSVTTDDNGKILIVSNGEWALELISNANGVSF